jgi:DNA-binding transcriptional LysR family regulator
MPDRTAPAARPPAHFALTPDALLMIDSIARNGSFAAAARELGKVPSALTYSVRQLEESLDVLLFDRRSRQAKLTAAGQELRDEGRRLLVELDAVASRVRRVATGWEAQLTVVADDIVARRPLLDLAEAFYALEPQGKAASGPGGPGTRLKLRTEVMAGTWEALVNGQADLAIGVDGIGQSPPTGVALAPLGEVPFVFVVAPSHPLARMEEPLVDTELLRQRAVAVADSARRLTPLTVNLLPGQDVLTVHSMADKIDAIARGLGCGFVPEPMARPAVAAGLLQVRRTQRAPQVAPLSYAWRCTAGRRKTVTGLALQWWLEQLAHPRTRQALLQGHA